MNEKKIKEEIDVMIEQLENEWHKTFNNDVLTYINGQLKSLYHLKTKIESYGK
jgi:hypothetical protein